MLETDWTLLRDLFLILLALLLMAPLIVAYEIFDDYLLKKLDERKAKKAR